MLQSLCESHHCYDFQKLYNFVGKIQNMCMHLYKYVLYLFWNSTKKINLPQQFGFLTGTYLHIYNIFMQVQGSARSSGVSPQISCDREQAAKKKACWNAWASSISTTSIYKIKIWTSSHNLHIIFYLQIIFVTNPMNSAESFWTSITTFQDPCRTFGNTNIIHDLQKHHYY